MPNGQEGGKKAPENQQEAPKSILKSRRRRQGNPEDTGKKVVFQDEATSRLRDWNYHHPNAAEDYLRASAAGKRRMITEYFSIQLHADKSLTHEEVMEKLTAFRSAEFIGKMASTAKSWETCVSFAQDPEMQNIVKNKGVGWEQYASKRLDRIEEEPTEIALGKRLAKDPQKYFERFNKKHPNIEREYYKSSPAKRTELLGEYLVGVLMKNTKDANLFALQKNVKQVDGQMILANIADKVQGWETCKELLNDKELQFRASNPDPNNERGDDFLKCAERLTENIQDNILINRIGLPIGLQNG